MHKRHGTTESNQLISLTPPTMSCCGEANVPNQTNQATTQNRQLINQQPGPHPGAQFHEKQHSFQQPTVTSPTPTHPYGQNTYAFQNGYQPQQWQHNSPSPPPINQFGAYGSPTSPGSPNGSSQMQLQPLLQPSPVHNASLRGDVSSLHARTLSPPLISIPQPRQEFKSPSDEGKMSVAIDFGECWYSVTIFGKLIASQVLHFREWLEFRR